MDADLTKLAKLDLREDETTREQSLEAMREWVAKHPDIKKCRTDDLFLLRFLRAKKHSIVQAQEMLERYLQVRKLYPAWFKGLDPKDPQLEDIINSGYIFPLPQRDSLGRRVIFTCTAKFDTHKYGSDQMGKAHSLVVESLMDNHENQIRGYVHVNDESGLSMAHISMWSLTDIRNMFKCIQNTLPMRFKMSHFLNVPGYATKIFEFFIALLSDKLKKRVLLHKVTSDLGEHIDLKLLPKEYGGEVSMSDMIESYKRELLEKREALLDLDNLDIDLNKKSKFLTELQDLDLTGISGSFRKLEVD